MNDANVVELAIEHLRARRWAGPDHHPRFEEFLMSESRRVRSKGFGTRLVLVVAMSAVTVTAAAAWVGRWWYTLHGADGSVVPVTVVDHADGTLTVVDPDGNAKTAYELRKDRPMRMSDMTPEELAALKEEMQKMQGEAMFAKVGETLVDPSGQEVAVTHDLSGVGPNGERVPGPDEARPAKKAAPKPGNAPRN